MLDFTYENQGSHTYLVYKFGEETIDTMILGMLTNNNIKGFAKPIYTEVNGEKFIKYNISAKISLDKLFLGSVNKNRILKIFINILDGLTRVDDYMLDAQHVLIDKDYIFADVSTSDVAMVCMPIVDYDSGVNLKEFFKNTIFSLSYDASENGDYIAKMIAYLNNDMNFTIEGFKEHLEGLLAGGASAPAAPQYNNYNQQMAPAQPAYAAPVQQPMMGTPAPMAPAAPAPAAPVAPQAADPNIQNVVNSSKSAKMVKRNEMLEAQQAELEKKNRIDLPPIGNNNSGMGFEIPGMGPAPIGGPAAAPAKPKKEKAPKEKKSKAKSAPAAPAASSEDDVSLMYLLQHYNKENAAKYKATKERKKNGGKAQAAATVAAPQAPARPQMQAPQAPAMPQMQAPQAPAMPQMQAPQAPAMPQMQAPQAPAMPQMQAPQAPAMPQMQAPQAPAMPQMQAPQASAMPQMQAPQAPAMPQMQTPQAPAMPQMQTPQAQPMQQMTQMQQTQMIQPQAQPAAPAPAAPQFTPVQQQAPSMPQFTHIQQQQAAPKAAPAPAPETPSMASMLGNNETTVLTSGVVLQTRPFLYRFKDGEKIFINKNTYKVGKSADVVDYCIEDNTAISRCHAIFYKIEDKYYVEDLNSTNGTYVDDEKITSNKKIPIRVGSRIKFANDEYELRFE